VKSGEAATAAGVSADTLRHYEKRGLLPAPPRTAGGYRDYPPATVERVRLIQGALAAGFTLGELALVMAERSRGGAPCRKVRALVGRRLEDVKTQTRELRRLERSLSRLLAEWDARLAGVADGGRAYLLESLPVSGLASRRARRPIGPSRDR